MTNDQLMQWLDAHKGNGFQMPDGSIVPLMVMHEYIRYARDRNEDDERLKRFIKAFEEWNPHEPAVD